MPQKIDALEAEQKAQQQRIADPDFYRQDKTAIAEGLAALDHVNEKLATAYARWEQLDAGS
jgi:ATP-binding cassette subfamily F protein uup